MGSSEKQPSGEERVGESSDGYKQSSEASLSSGETEKETGGPDELAGDDTANESSIYIDAPEQAGSSPDSGSGRMRGVLPSISTVIQSASAEHDTDTETEAGKGLLLPRIPLHLRKKPAQSPLTPAPSSDPAAAPQVKGNGNGDAKMGGVDDNSKGNNGGRKSGSSEESEM